ncbi:sugar transferase [Candidatus Sororendozoicomonas aggregata]|uniref:sugar transferase n=1 Tax=Candidatus Sororendozoicomonas aggregata TaxID=3073239 RepID=UPI002ED0C83C
MLVILFFPLFIIVAMIIKIDSRGSIIFKQTRVGLNGKHFSIYKFRSMNADASNTGPYFTGANDKRITKFGGFIRKTSIDELPQLFNVLLGNMSFVGPRPNVPAQEKEYDRQQWIKRHSVKPGITGLAQATLRSEATPKQRTALDLEYVDRDSMTMDFHILFMTVKQIVSKGGN